MIVFGCTLHCVVGIGMEMAQLSVQQILLDLIVVALKRAVSLKSRGWLDPDGTV
jgi:hypothetical protein